MLGFFFHKTQRTSKFACGKINQGNDILSKASFRNSYTDERRKLGCVGPDSSPEEDHRIPFCCTSI